MARALARGWGDPVICSDSGSGRARALVNELGGEAAATNLEVAQRADLVVLAHKPYQLGEVAREIRGHVKAIASVLGGTTLTRLRDAYPNTPVYLLMPNTPVEVRRGVIMYAEPAPPPSGAVAGDPQLEAEVLELFARLGSVIRVPERLLGTAGAVMSVGPAYQALLVEAQVDAGVRRGLGAELASRLVLETITGTAALIAERSGDTLAVRREVTSPGGSTARGLAALEAAGIRSAFQHAIDAVVDGGGSSR